MEGAGGEDAPTGRAEEEELVKRKGGWGGDEDRAMGARLSAWQMPGQQGLRHMKQGCGWGPLEGGSSREVRAKADFGSEGMAGKPSPGKTGLLV